MPGIHRYSTIVFASLLAWAAFPRPAYSRPNGMTLLGHIDPQHGTSHQGTHYSSCWGYVSPGGREYAFLSTYSGMSVIDINGDSMKEIQFIPGPTSGYCYREIKTWKHYGYIVYDFPDSMKLVGVQIVDLQGLPDTAVLVKTFLYADSSAGNVATSHTLTLADGYLYCNGSSHYSAGGCVVFSLRNDPLTPEFAGAFEPQYLHDTYVRNDTLYGSAIYAGGGLYLADVRDKANPVVLGKITYAGSGTHNSWASIDGKYAFTADEIGTTYHDMKVWALDSLPNSVMAAEWSADPTTSIHNVYGRGHYLYVAHYKAGMRVVDAHDPRNPVEVGSYDTYTPDPDPVASPYAGCWGVYPYFPSGKWIGSDMQTGLYLCRFDSLLPRLRPALLEPASGFTGPVMRFRWTKAARQEEDPHWYDLHIEGASLDTIFSTRDTLFDPANSTWRFLSPYAGYSWHVRVRDEFTEVCSVDTFAFTYIPLDGVKDGRQSPPSWELRQNYPNPFNPFTRIAFTLGEPSHVTLTVFDVTGRTVRTLVNGQMLGSGPQEVVFDAGHLASGVYYYRLSTPRFTRVDKMLLTR